MSFTKLDTYDYDIQGNVIRIALVGSNDPTLVDVLSELDESNGHIYVEGRRYIFAGYEIIKSHVSGNFLDLYVAENY